MLLYYYYMPDLKAAKPLHVCIDPQIFVKHHNFEKKNYDVYHT